jgi:hypothetical protein
VVINIYLGVNNMTESILKNKFREALKDQDINQHKYLLKDALEHIGDIDSELRDDLILEYLFKLFIEADLDTQELNEITLELISNLYVGINEISDLVFKRTFSMLALVALIKRHTIKPWMSYDLQQRLIYESIESFSLEKDMRGYVEHKGWAHAGAHGADLFLAISKLESITVSDLFQMLDIVYAKLCKEQFTFNLGEDKRMARAVSEIFKHKNLNRKKITTWINTFRRIDGHGISMVISKSNARNFVTALSVYMKHDQEIVDLCHEINEVLVLG